MAPQTSSARMQVYAIWKHLLSTWSLPYSMSSVGSVVRSAMSSVTSWFCTPPSRKCAAKSKVLASRSAGRINGNLVCLLWPGTTYIGRTGPNVCKTGCSPWVCQTHWRLLVFSISRASASSRTTSCVGSGEYWIKMLIMHVSDFP